ncbi:MAG: PadR family transcriptional regulator [Actinomycetota bacterium]|nr:PadR family transcriptional regulator [Actinomycetota bacterium]
MQKLPTTSYVVLGLLERRPRSGYDLVAFADRSIAYFWPVSRSLVYRELGRLVELGLVAATEVTQEKLPDKRLYSLTEQGKQALERWLDEPGFEEVRYRNGFLVKLFLGGRMAHEQRKDLLEEYREAIETELTDLTATVARLERDPGARLATLTALHGVRQMQARLTWIDEVAEELIRPIEGVGASKRLPVEGWMS